jgi:hypothetical protein
LRRAEPCVHSLIPLDIAANLFDPKSGVSPELILESLEPSFLPAAAVPEIAVHEDRYLPPGKNDVRTSWEAVIVEPKS